MKLFSHDTKAEALSGAPLFQGLSEEDLLALAKATEDMEVPAGRVQQPQIERKIMVELAKRVLDE